MQLHLARLDPRDVENVVDDAEQVGAAVVDVLSIFSVFLRTDGAHYLFLDHVGETYNRIERGTQFMAHIS